MTPAIPSVVLELFPGRSTQRRRIKILPWKQMLQRFSILLAQVQTNNISENMINEIWQIVYSLYWAKTNSKKIIQQLNQVNIGMRTIFLNSENSKNSDQHGLVLNLTDKKDLKRGNKYFSKLRIYYTQKNINTLYRNDKFKFSGTTTDK